jgi:farnesyl-diphosphate farnesyltransferase
MGNGMADYATGEHRENTSVATIKDFDLYCHYVAGLVGHGLSDLFAASGLETDELSKERELSNTMGLFLQKTNIIRDYREDLDDGRQFWPREIWGKYADNFSDFTKPDHKVKVKLQFIRIDRREEREKEVFVCIVDINEEYMCVYKLIPIPKKKTLIV